MIPVNILVSKSIAFWILLGVGLILESKRANNDLCFLTTTCFFVRGFRTLFGFGSGGGGSFGGGSFGGRSSGGNWSDILHPLVNLVGRNKVIIKQLLHQTK